LRLVQCDFTMRAMNDRLLYLSDGDVARVGPSMPEVIAALERMFREKAAGCVEMPSKLGIHPRNDAFLHAMPAHVPSVGAAGVKWVSAYPENAACGLPQIAGLIIVNDAGTGLPIAVMDAAWVTAQRTAAASALAARHLARRDASTLGVLGCGVQGRSHLAAMVVEFPLQHVRAYDVSPAASRWFVEEMSRAFDVDILAVDRPEEAVCDCNIVVTAGPITKIPHGTLRAGWLATGACGISVDFVAYWDARALKEVDLITTDDVAQLDRYRELGYFTGLPPIRTELSELVVGEHPGRTSADERTLACHLGLALEDVVVARIVVDRAIEANVGRWLPR